MCWGIWFAEAAIEAGAIEAASTETPPFKESMNWDFLSLTPPSDRMASCLNARAVKSSLVRSCHGSRCRSARAGSYAFSVLGVNPVLMIGLGEGR
jgi:hypothetical protein